MINFIKFKFEWKNYFNKIFQYSNNKTINDDDQILVDDWEYIEKAIEIYNDALKNRRRFFLKFKFTFFNFF